MAPIGNLGSGRWLVAAAFTLVVAACGSSSAVDIQSLGLDVEADIQAGARFELALPVQPGTTIELVSAPPGVTASLSEAGGGSLLLSVAVDADTPRGAYNLALRVDQDGDTHELGWPFEVVDPSTTLTTAPGTVDVLLTVDSPRPGDVVGSPATISGSSSTGQVGYTLTGGGDVVLAEGTIDVVDGFFSETIQFDNTCCIELALEVFHPSPNGTRLTIPITYPESG